MYVNKNLLCEKCGKNFILSAGEHEYRVSLGNHELPTICPTCEGKVDETLVEHEVNCSICGKTSKVFFSQAPERPVYCFDCLKNIEK